MKTTHLLSFFFLIIMLPYKGLCTIIHIPAAYTTIQAGIDASANGDIVVVDPGTYYEHLNLNGKNITLCSNYFTTGNSSYIASTILDGNISGRVITINQGENSSCQVIGFTIQNGNSISEALPWGGGVLISESSPLIRNCIIQSNYSPSNGGGLAIDGLSSAAKVLNCTIQYNVVDNSGGGVYMGDCSTDAEIINCTILGNTNSCSCDFSGGGGGVNLYHRGKLVNCLIVNNSAPNSQIGGGGIFCDWGNYYSTQGIFITGCTIANNSSFNSGGEGYVIYGGEFRNCILWGNTDVFNNIYNYDGSSYINCCTDPLPAGTGNIDADPMFVDPLNGDFRLSAGSPCINAGDNAFNTEAFDLDGNLRVLDNTIDIGAYEYGSPAGTTVQVGGGSDISDRLPVETWYGFNYSQQLYLGSEIAAGGGSAGTITRIRFFYASGPQSIPNSKEWTIYLGNTTKSVFTSYTDWVPVTSMTQVFSGTINDPVEGTWLEISLTTPFIYSGNNLVVAIDENTPGYDNPSQWGSFITSTDRGLSFRDDNINPDPASPPGATYGPVNTVAQVQFDIANMNGILEGYVTVEPGCSDPVTGATVTTGLLSATTDGTGFYHMSVPPGTYYDVTAHYGDVSQTISPVVVMSGSTTNLNFCMPPYFAPPVNLEATTYGPVLNNVHLTWMEPGSIPDQWIHWDNGTIYGGLGFGDYAGTFQVASRWPVADIAPYNGKYLKKIRFVITEATASYTLKVWKGVNASTLLLSQVVVDPIINNWTEITLTSPVLIDGTDELWFGYEVYQTSGYPAGLGPGPAVAGKGDMYNPGGGWFSMKEAWNWEFNWTLQGFVSESSTMAPQQLIPMVQEKTQSPVTVNQAAGSVKPQVIQLAPDIVAKFASPSNLTGEKTETASVSPLVPSAGTLTGYNVYRDNVMIGNNVPDLFYDDLLLSKGGYDYEVSAQYDIGESSKIGPLHVDIYTCFPPTQLTVSNSTLTTTMADISWTPSVISTNHQWNLEWGLKGFAQGSGTNVFVNSTPGTTLLGLIPGNEYDVYVRTYCNSTDQSPWVKKTFRTHYFDCPPGATVESEICGSITNNGCDMATPAFESISCGETVCGTSWLHRSHRDSDWYSFTITETSDVTLTGNAEFAYMMGFSASPCTSPPVFLISATSSPGYTNSFFKQLSPGTYYAYFAPLYSDQIECDSLSRYWVKLGCSTCLTPWALNAINITDNSADLTWSSTSSLWNIEWGPTGFTQGSGTMISGTNQNPYQLTGLTVGYSYSFYVQSDCGVGDASYWSGPYTFFLPCPPVSVPYSEDFTSQLVGSTPQCWQVLGAGVPSNWTVDYSNSAGGNSPELVFHSYPWIYGTPSYLTSPLINTTGQTSLTLTFNHYLYLNNPAASCGIYTTSDGGVTWNPVMSLLPTGGIGHESINLTIATPDVGSPNFQFAFGTNGYSWDIGNWNIDDISLAGSSKTLTLHVLLEGLTKPRDLGAGPVSPPAGTMYEAMNELIEPKWGSGVADTITVEFYTPVTYTLAQRFTAVRLLTNASATIDVPSILSDSYWIRVSTRNHVAVWSSSTVSFSGSGADYDFTDDGTKAFENSGGSPTALKSIGSGKYAMWVGSMQNDTEVVQFIDTDDASAVVPFVINGDVGYLVPDMDGAGWVDIDDAAYIDTNLPPGVYEQRPQD